MPRYVAQSNSAITKWWSKVAEACEVFLRVMTENNAIKPDERLSAIAYLQKRQAFLRNQPCPADAQGIRDDLVQAMQNLEASLEYAEAKNTYESHLRYQVAQSNMNSVRFQLLAYNILL